MWTHIILLYPSASTHSHHRSCDDQTELGPLRVCTRHRKRRGRRKGLLTFPLHLTLVTAFLFTWISMSALCSGSVLRNNCRKVGYRTVVDEAGCDLVAVFLNRCSGYCMSFSFPNPLNHNRITAYAKCCRMTEVEEVEVSINCNEGIRRVRMPSAKACSCFDCA